MQQAQRTIRQFLWSALHTDPQFRAWSTTK